MPRSDITSAGKEVGSDDGAVLVSIAQGEQFPIEIEVDPLTDMTGYTLVGKVVEAANQGDGVKPTSIEPGGVTTELTIVNDTLNDNLFSIVIPADLADNWSVQPTPDRPSYGYIGVSIADTGTGALQKIHKPVRGMVEVRFSPTV